MGLLKFSWWITSFISSHYALIYQYYCKLYLSSSHLLTGPATFSLQLMYVAHWSISSYSLMNCLNLRSRLREYLLDTSSVFSGFLVVSCHLGAASIKKLKNYEVMIIPKWCITIQPLPPCCIRVPLPSAQGGIEVCELVSLVVAVRGTVFFLLLLDAIFSW